MTVTSLNFSNVLKISIPPHSGRYQKIGTKIDSASLFANLSLTVLRIHLISFICVVNSFVTYLHTLLAPVQ